MANNSNRKAIEFMVQGALPPHSTNVLWMDTSVPELPVLKIFENGAWTACHTESSKEIDMLVQAVENLTESNNNQSKVIVDLTDEIKSLSDWEGREQERDEAISDFRTTLMGNKGEVRIRPLVAAKVVENGTEHCGFIAQIPNEDKQIFYDGITPDTGIFFTATKSEGLLNAYEGQTSGFPLGIKSGVEAFYPIADWHVCTEAPQDITSDVSTWQTAVVQAGEVWRCKEEHKYYNSNEEYICSVYVYEKVGQGEVTLDDIKEISKDILYSVENIDTSTLAKQGSNPNATLSEVQTQATSAASDAAAAKTAAQGITGYALQGVDETATNTAILQAIQANAGVPILTIPDSTASQELAPNVLYVFDNRTSTLTLTLGTPIVGIANEYHLFLVIGSTAPTITWPTGISWNGGSAPTIAADKTYEISILNNIAAYFEV